MSFPYLIISDVNYKSFMGTRNGGQRRALNPVLQGPSGYRGWHDPAKPRSFTGPRPVSQVIARSEWTARITAGHGSWLSDLVKQRAIQAKDQGELEFCWVYGSTRASELWRIMGGMPWLDLSPESVGGPCTRWRNQGGYASEAFDQLENYGACENSYMNAPRSLQPRLWKAGWQQNALTHELPDWYDLESSDAQPIFDEVITCLLNRVPVAAGLGWWGHLVCFLDPVILPPGTPGTQPNTPDGATVGVLAMNSWGIDWPDSGDNGLFCLSESRATPDGAAAPVAPATLPMWSKDLSPKT